MRVHVRGGGIVGLACAAELLDRGHDVVVVDPTPGCGASAVAAGMLSPGGEAWHGEPDVHRLGVASARLWPAYAARLAVPLHACGTLLVGHDAGDGQEVDRQVQVLAGLGVAVDVLPPGAARDLEPGLGRTSRALLLHDAAVDPRAVVAALLDRLGDRVRAREPDATPDAVVVATGARLPQPWTSLVRGVRGEVVRLRTSDGPRHVVRGWVAGEPVYLVPRAGGEVVVGATVEEHDAAPVPTAGGVLRLLRAARVLLPALDRAELLACEARDRPATRDHLPLVGPTHDPRTWLAAGHFRHGVLLAPLTARMLADALEGAAPDPAVDPRRLLPTPDGGVTCA
ncbi:glycine oxidase [Nocardioides sp. BE266]|uniref:FAD-dependent oxidoreductase n=1 Tax=Nocardioides sp. BE266 TaxID=2817725 RepID=UPI0028557E9A|nr:FAD-dependent oxidoreductase [Nocardioides sp. BE266]MDR7252199.1 glycine oxidase [Nocardioides sp. BE266]